MAVNTYGVGDPIKILEILKWDLHSVKKYLNEVGAILSCFINTSFYWCFKHFKF